MIFSGINLYNNPWITTCKKNQNLKASMIHYDDGMLGHKANLWSHLPDHTIPLYHQRSFAKFRHCNLVWCSLVQFFQTACCLYGIVDFISCIMRSHPGKFSHFSVPIFSHIWSTANFHLLVQELHKVLICKFAICRA